MSELNNLRKEKISHLTSIVGDLPESVMVYKQTDELLILNQGELLDNHSNLSEVFIAFPIYILSIYIHKVERLIEEISFSETNKDSFEALTAREKDVLKHIALGKSNKEIASTLFISVNTVETHRKNIKRKLHITTFYDINYYARAYNLI